MESPLCVEGAIVSIARGYVQRVFQIAGDQGRQSLRISRAKNGAPKASRPTPHRKVNTAKRNKVFFWLLFFFKRKVTCVPARSADGRREH